MGRSVQPPKIRLMNVSPHPFPLPFVTRVILVLETPNTKADEKGATMHSPEVHGHISHG